MRTLLIALVAAGCAKPPVLSGVNFVSGSTEVANPSDLQLVDEVVEVLESSNWDVIVVGLADTEGDEAANQKLSIARAEYVADLLRKRSDVEDSRIVVYGMGEKLAVGERLKERKVEFVFYKDQGEPVREVVRASGALDPDYDRKRKADAHPRR